MSTEVQHAQFRFIPADSLTLSPLNVRKTGGEAGIDQLAELIFAEGVLQNLNVHAQSVDSDGKATHGVVAGGRRLRALQRLIEQGRITPDYPVPCMVVSDERAVQISLSENSGREPMHGADEFEAFRQLVDAGQCVEEVAARFGVTPLIVQRRLKLANVSPRFIQMYRDGKTTLEMLMALSVTDDHERQHQAWESLKSYERQPETLRDLLTQGEVSMKEPMARFVGLKAYQKAGGVVRRDLFAEDNDALLDATLVRTLAAEKLEKHAAKLREGIAWVETHLAFDYAARAAYGRVRTTLRARSAEEQSQLDALRAERDEIQASIDSSDGETPEYDTLLARLEEVEGQIEALDDQRTVPDPEQQALAGAVVFIGRDGKVSIERDLLKAEDADRFLRAQKASEQKNISEAPRLHSPALTRRLTAQRTLALQAELVQQPMTAMVALTHRLVLTTFYDGGIYRDSAVQINVGPTLLAQHAAELEATAAQETVTAHRQRHADALPSDPEELLPWLTAQSGGVLMALLAYCVAVTVDGVRSSEEGGALDTLAGIAKLDMKRWWRPTAENYFGSIPKARILAAVTEGTSASAAAALAKLPKAALAEAAERQLANTGWLPTLMRAAE